MRRNWYTRLVYAGLHAPDTEMVGEEHVEAKEMATRNYWRVETCCLSLPKWVGAGLVG